jgi:hypothetical protein
LKGAAVLLAWYGLLFIGQGMLVKSCAIAIGPAMRSVSRWYLFLWVALVRGGRLGFRRGCLGARAGIVGLPRRTCRWDHRRRGRARSIGGRTDRRCRIGQTPQPRLVQANV